MKYLKRTPVSLRLSSEIPSFLVVRCLVLTGFAFYFKMFWGSRHPLKNGAVWSLKCLKVSENVKCVTGRFLSASPYFFFPFLCPIVRKIMLLLILDIALFGLRTSRL